MSFLGLKHTQESRAKMSAALMGRKRTSTKTLMERFMEKVSPEPMSGCWLWMGGANKHGYGNFGIGSRTTCAHIAAYKLFVGPIPDGLELDHKCQVEECVNPHHLRPVTHKENCDRRDTSNFGIRSREKTHCPRGHEYTEENTRLYHGRRHCRACDRIRGSGDRRTLLSAGPRDLSSAEAA